MQLKRSCWINFAKHLDYCVKSYSSIYTALIIPYLYQFRKESQNSLRTILGKCHNSKGLSIKSEMGYKFQFIFFRSTHQPLANLLRREEKSKTPIVLRTRTKPQTSQKKMVLQQICQTKYSQENCCPCLCHIKPPLCLMDLPEGKSSIFSWMTIFSCWNIMNKLQPALTGSC